MQKITMKTSVKEAILSKIKGLQPATLLKKDFFLKFQEIFQKSCFSEHFRKTAFEICRTSPWGILEIILGDGGFYNIFVRGIFPDFLFNVAM